MQSGRAKVVSLNSFIEILGGAISVLAKRVAKPSRMVVHPIGGAPKPRVCHSGAISVLEVAKRVAKPLYLCQRYAPTGLISY